MADSPQWKSLFYFTTRRHLLFIIPAVLFATGSGLTVPANAYALGKVFSSFTKFGTGAANTDEFKHDVTKYNKWIVVIGSGSWLFNSVAFFLWHTFGELQAQSARERLFNALLKHDIAWYDTRKDGVGALSTRLLAYVTSICDQTDLR